MPEHPPEPDATPELNRDGNECLRQRGDHILVGAYRLRHAGGLRVSLLDGLFLVDRVESGLRRVDLGVKLRGPNGPGAVLLRQEKRCARLPLPLPAAWLHEPKFGCHLQVVKESRKPARLGSTAGAATTGPRAYLPCPRHWRLFPTAPAIIRRRAMPGGRRGRAGPSTTCPPRCGRGRGGPSLRRAAVASVPHRVAVAALLFVG